MPSPAPSRARSSQSARRILGALRRRMRCPGPLACLDMPVMTIHAEAPTSGPYASISAEIDEALRRRGHVHIAYENALFDYGHAWQTTRYICETFAAASGDAVGLVSHQPCGWDDHQDVLAFVREA